MERAGVADVDVAALRTEEAIFQPNRQPRSDGQHVQHRRLDVRRGEQQGCRRIHDMGRPLKRWAERVATNIADIVVVQ
jgi:hypothetical protein